MGEGGVTLEALAGGPPLDVAIVGGGINGAGIFREAARAGLRAALFEADDFGFGTTWRSTKLIHGGLRYLEHGDVRLVRESLREREFLLRTRPHLVRPLPFLFPLLPWTRRPAWQIRAGLLAYDLLAWPRSLPGHRSFSAEEVRLRAPGIAPEQRGGFGFYDARCRAPERLALELVLEGVAAGGTAFNHARVTRILVEAGRVHAVEVEHGGARITVPAQTVVNAAGPWADIVREHAGAGGRPLLDLTRGTHIVLERDERAPRAALISTARSDGRVFFVIPNDRTVLIGTTDVRYTGDPAAVRPERWEIEYLLDEANALLPGLGAREEDVRYAYAGLRPLRNSGARDESAVSRREALIDHGANGGPAGLYSVVGGKLSTARPLARRFLAAIGRRPAAEEAPPRGSDWEEVHRSLGQGAPRRLAAYGPLLADVVALGRDLLCDCCWTLAGEVRHAVRVELASTLSDVLLRRTGIAWLPCRGLDCAERVADVMAEECAWTAAEKERQLEAYRRDLRQHLPTPAELEAAAARVEPAQ